MQEGILSFAAQGEEELDLLGPMPSTKALPSGVRRPEAQTGF
jgi:hypothetical protein